MVRNRMKASTAYACGHPTRQPNAPARPPRAIKSITPALCPHCVTNATLQPHRITKAPRISYIHHHDPYDPYIHTLLPIATHLQTRLSILSQTLNRLALPPTGGPAYSFTSTEISTLFTTHQTAKDATRALNHWAQDYATPDMPLPPRSHIAATVILACDTLAEVENLVREIQDDKREREAEAKRRETLRQLDVRAREVLRAVVWAVVRGLRLPRVEELDREVEGEIDGVDGVDQNYGQQEQHQHQHQRQYQHQHQHQHQQQQQQQQQRNPPIQTYGGSRYAQPFSLPNPPSSPPAAALVQLPLFRATTAPAPAPAYHTHDQTYRAEDINSVDAPPAYTADDAARWERRFERGRGVGGMGGVGGRTGYTVFDYEGYEGGESVGGVQERRDEDYLGRD